MWGPSNCSLLSHLRPNVLGALHAPIFPVPLQWLVQHLLVTRGWRYSSCYLPPLQSADSPALSLGFLLLSLSIWPGPRPPWAGLRRPFGIEAGKGTCVQERGAGHCLGGSSLICFIWSPNPWSRVTCDEYPMPKSFTLSANALSFPTAHVRSRQAKAGLGLVRGGM